MLSKFFNHKTKTKNEKRKKVLVEQCQNLISGGGRIFQKIKIENIPITFSYKDSNRVVE